MKKWKRNWRVKGRRRRKVWGWKEKFGRKRIERGKEDLEKRSGEVEWNVSKYIR